jgi:hypothetical protein
MEAGTNQVHPVLVCSLGYPLAHEVIPFIRKRSCLSRSHQSRRFRVPISVVVTLHSNPGKCVWGPRYCTQFPEVEPRLCLKPGQSGLEWTRDTARMGESCGRERRRSVAEGWKSRCVARDLPAYSPSSHRYSPWCLSKPQRSQTINKFLWAERYGHEIISTRFEETDLVRNI